MFEANPGEMKFGSSYLEVQETEDSRNRDSTVCINNKLKHNFASSCKNEDTLTKFQTLLHAFLFKQAK